MKLAEQPADNHNYKNTYRKLQSKRPKRTSAGYYNLEKETHSTKTKFPYYKIKKPKASVAERKQRPPMPSVNNRKEKKYWKKIKRDRKLNQKSKAEINTTTEDNNAESSVPIDQKLLDKLTELMFQLSRLSNINNKKTRKLNQDFEKITAANEPESTTIDQMTNLDVDTTTAVNDPEPTTIAQIKEAFSLGFVKDVNQTAVIRPYKPREKISSSPRWSPNFF